MDNPLLPISIIICLALSAYFSATETAISSVSRPRLKAIEESGDARAKTALRVTERYDDALSAILIGNNIVNIAASSIGTILCIDIFGESLGALASTIIMTLLVLTFGEILPKSMAKENSEMIALLACGPLSVLMKVLYPLIWLFVRLKKLVIGRFHKQDTPTVTEEELRYIIEETVDEGVLEEHESELIQSALEFNDTTASEILTPRVDVVGVDVESVPQEVAGVFLSERYSRLVVYEKSIDSIIGIITLKDFFSAYLQDPNFDLRTIMQEVMFVPPGKLVYGLLKELQKQKAQIAVVVDQYGGTLGVVSLEDILEELVGEIWDEDEENVSLCTAVGDGVWQAAGETHVDDLLEQIAPDVTLEEDHPTTLSGWIVDQIERIPEAGESFELEGLSIKVLAMDEHVIKRVEIHVPQKTENTEE